MTSMSDLLKRVTPDHGVDWGVVVGATLAGLTVPLGVNDAGILRVMAVNETAERELQARAESLVAVWNLAAEREGTRLAQSLQSWVRDGLVTRSSAGPPRERAVRAVVAKPTISERYRSDADAMTGPVQDASVREALVEMRAKSLAADARTDQGE
jgi:hypothetical protein